MLWYAMNQNKLMANLRRYEDQLYKKRVPLAGGYVRNIRMGHE